MKLALCALALVFLLLLGCASQPSVPQQQAPQPAAPAPSQPTGQQPGAPQQIAPQPPQGTNPPPGNDTQWQGPSECAGRKEGDLNLPQTCVNWFASQKGQKPGAPQGQGEPGGRQNEVTVRFTNATYQSVLSSRPTGWFATGQAADIMLSGIGFNNAGGPLLFNHPGLAASDGVHLLLADRNNNRILIWNKLPVGNVAPDVVLGQADFYSNNPGTGLGQMDWPVSVAVGGGKVVVADTYNNRLLIWNSFPTRNGQPADLVINTGGSGLDVEKKRSLLWPWGVWTDGKKMAATSTLNSVVLLWDEFPTQNDQAADVYLTGNGKMGTPRTITSDGKSLIVGDHNARTSAQAGGMTVNQGNFFWKSWPTRDEEPYDFFMSDPSDAQGGWMQGSFTDDGKLVMLGSKLHIWSAFPQSAEDKPGLSVGPFIGGDGSGALVVGAKVYLSLDNGNMIVGFNSLPASADAKPEFVIGSPAFETNTLETNFIMSNPVPATDSKSLFVSSDFDRKLYVWKKLPGESNAHPDFVYSLPDAPWDNALFNGTLVLAGKKTVFIWKKLPFGGEMPDEVLQGSIGSVAFQDLKGVAMDERYFYLSDGQANKIYVWEGIPSKDSEPKFTIATDQPVRLSSDGKYLVVTATESGTGGSIRIYRVSDLQADSQPVVLGGPGVFNLPQDAVASQGHLFVGDTGFNRVLIWKNIEDAMAGRSADVVLGQASTTVNRDAPPEIGRDRLFWPADIAFDGSYLWVGEFKFSERLLRFSVK